MLTSHSNRRCCAQQHNNFQTTLAKQECICCIVNEVILVLTLFDDARTHLQSSLKAAADVQSWALSSTNTYWGWGRRGAGGEGGSLYCCCCCCCSAGEANEGLCVCVCVSVTVWMCVYRVISCSFYYVTHQRAGISSRRPSQDFNPMLRLYFNPVHSYYSDQVSHFLQVCTVFTLDTFKGDVLNWLVPTTGSGTTIGP